MHKKLAIAAVAVVTFGFLVYELARPVLSLALLYAIKFHVDCLTTGCT